MKDEAMRESDLTRIINNKIYPGDSRIVTPQGLMNIGDGSMGGTHWTFFHEKDNKPYYLNSFAGVSEKFSLQQLPKPITFRRLNYQDNNSKLCGAYC